MAEEWFYTNQGKQMGPITSAELRRLAASEQLLPTDLVWKEGLPKWVPASSAKGLFSQGAAAAAEPAPLPVAPLIEEEPETAPPRRRSGADDDLEQRPRRRRREDEEELEPRPQRRKRSRSGLSPALLIGLIVGGVVLLLVVGIGAAVLVVMLASTGGSYTVNLQPRQEDVRAVQLTVRSTEVTVTSDSASDVDLIIRDSAGRVVALDESIGPNSRVVFTPPLPGTYFLVVRNLGPFPARSQVRYH